MRVHGSNRLVYLSPVHDQVFVSLGSDVEWSLIHFHYPLSEWDWATCFLVQLIWSWCFLLEGDVF